MQRVRAMACSIKGRYNGAAVESSRFVWAVGSCAAEGSEWVPRPWISRSRTALDHMTGAQSRLI